MKILKIRGENLASLEGVFEIDFTVEPLKSAGIFAITGATGSGKSTILDALCLALYDNTPRLSRGVENIQILDVQDKTINQRDSRTILRKGAVNGFAEVEFLSLGGEQFCSTWSVRRARDRAEGGLKMSAIRLFNLSTNSEVSGGKTELLSIISQLIGLSFDQFTRAVLLAQGDFSAFLKAKKNEKAELLEKLTGTDIYSRISTNIYAKSQKAQQDLDIILSRLKDIELLSEEDLMILTSQRANLIVELKTLKSQSEIIEAKLRWISNNKLLEKDIQEAQQRVESSLLKFQHAKPRYDCLSLVDSVQEVRDDYNELKSARGQIVNNNHSLKKYKLDFNTNIEEFNKLNEIIVAKEKELNILNLEWRKIEPQINKAQELDFNIISYKQKKEEVSLEVDKQSKDKKKKEINIQQTTKEISILETSISELDSWFIQMQGYKSIVSSKDLIISLIRDYENAILQKQANEGLIKTSIDSLKEQSDAMVEAEKEANELNEILSTEVLNLRAKLEEGRPCLVCGSIHHIIVAQGDEHSLEEKTLIRSKELVAQRIEKLIQSIKGSEIEKIRLESSILNYTNHSLGVLDKLSGYLNVFQGWKNEIGSLGNKVDEISSQWLSKQAEQESFKIELAQKQPLLESLKIQILEIAESLIEKESRLKEVETQLIGYNEQRKIFFAGQSIEMVKSTYTNKNKTFVEEINNSKEKLTHIIALKEQNQGNINQINILNIEFEEKSKSLSAKIQNWAENREDKLTSEQLRDLLSIDLNFIAKERDELTKLKEDNTIAQTTFEERKLKYSQHSKADTKPLEQETNEILVEIQEENKIKLEAKTSEYNEIEYKLKLHNENKEKIKGFEKEIEQKKDISENWKKLQDLLGSASGDKFKEIAQGYTLDSLLIYANKHLHELTQRYELQRIPNSLGLQVIDLDMLGEVRTVYSLSGGESFLISLSLALALSSLSSNRMRVESLFIDEGFGSLDIDTLRVAMDALERLQMQGRKIGVISHVAEMTESIACQIQVHKTANGRSRIGVVGL